MAATAAPDAISPAFLTRARLIASEHSKLSEQLSGEYDVKLAQKVGELSATARVLSDWESATKSLVELQQMLSNSSTDPEIRSIAAEELITETKHAELLSTQLKRSLVPVHPFAHMPCLIEIRPGVGGSEAALFAGDLLRMYQTHCQEHNFRVSFLKLDNGDATGNGSEIREAVLEVEGDGAYGILRCESGVHRVQRVPATESKGRTHTSAVSVVVLPNFPSTGNDGTGENSFDDPSSDYYIDKRDVRTDVMRARGAGGQHVNTTDSAIRLTHMPTNTVVAIQDSRSQMKNREKAWRLLRAKIAQARRDAREEEMAQLRLSLVGVAKAGRGDKIRTYNWSQQRVTDHRSGLTLYDLDGVLQGGDALDHIMNSVRNWFTEQDLEALIADDNLATAAKQTRSKIEAASG